MKPRILLPATIHGDIPFEATFAEDGLHSAYVNQHGAVSVMATNGKLLGIKPSEYRCPTLERAGWQMNERGWWHPPSCVAAWPLDEAWDMHIQGAPEPPEAD